ncbi:hypothetical protein [Sinanaerobacter sp. ZZT-01]|uniref:hypothetical protein n=1 Tax=Sinanaerobacter sp. ZZT-01 TaxID=3111540 RepID=UPI002D764E57|nr:hypothetical protein [Sinanaerobacter sp. ZZT-01]WRR94250.1 hypothetical protein U5921_03775 [Sinanaerobacter sp. ZZT-01]
MMLCKYKIFAEGAQFALYRRLENKEEEYYTEELERLKYENRTIWLRLDVGEKNELITKKEKLMKIVGE